MNEPSSHEPASLPYSTHGGNEGRNAMKHLLLCTMKRVLYLAKYYLNRFME